MEKETLRARCAEFLYLEAEYLDEWEFRSWLGLLAEDICYEVPVRTTRGLGNREDDFSGTGFHMKEGFDSLSMRVERLYTGRAFGEDPPSRTCRMISNIRLVDFDGDDEISVNSKFACYRASGIGPEFDLLMGDRQDRLRLRDDKIELCHRRVLFAHTTLPTANLGLFV